MRVATDMEAYYREAKTQNVRALTPIEQETKECVTHWNSIVSCKSRHRRASERWNERTDIHDVHISTSMSMYTLCAVLSRARCVVFIHFHLLLHDSVCFFNHSRFLMVGTIRNITYVYELLAKEAQMASFWLRCVKIEETVCEFHKLSGVHFATWIILQHPCVVELAFCFKPSLYLSHPDPMFQLIGTCFKTFTKCSRC